MPFSGCRRAWRVGCVVLLGASLAACFDSKRIIFTGEANLLDGGAAGVAGAAPEARAIGVEPAAVVGGERAADPAPVVEATPLGAGGSAPLDAGIVPDAVDAAAVDASPPAEPAAP